MEFTEAIPCWNGAALISADGSLLATLNRMDSGNVLAVSLYNVQNGGLVRRLIPPVLPDLAAGRSMRSNRVELHWAPNSRLLALAEHGSARIFVWDVAGEDERVLCVIRENGMLGMESVRWAPDSRHLLVHLAHRVGIRLWSIESRFAKAYFASPKFTTRGLCFSRDGRWMALLHRREGHEVIALYDMTTPDWQLARSMCSPESASLDDLVFSPLSESAKAPLIAWESPAFSSRIFVFAPDGQSCRVIESEDERVQTTSLLDFGFERFVWAPCGWLAVAVRDNHSFAVWNAITQKMSVRTVEVGPLGVTPGETVTGFFLGWQLTVLDCLQGTDHQGVDVQRGLGRSLPMYKDALLV